MFWYSTIKTIIPIQYISMNNGTIFLLLQRVNLFIIVFNHCKGYWVLYLPFSLSTVYPHSLLFSHVHTHILLVASSFLSIILKTTQLPQETLLISGSNFKKSRSLNFQVICLDYTTLWGQYWRGPLDGNIPKLCCFPKTWFDHGNCWELQIGSLWLFRFLNMYFLF